ncbi:MAG: MFS transporter [Holosporales bacterium]|jgi:MHS family proline/betaine transporter-like MFS transporter|nr:MFS transporter [Holosporales bacterium]
MNTAKVRWKSIFLSSLGNILEWFDYAIFGAFSAIMAKNFFSNEVDGYFAQLCVYAVFAVGFIGRPIGGVIFGHIGDLYGRKKVLFSSILLMAVSTAIIGMLPTYREIGAFAPTMLVLMRLCQGMAIGGEYTGGMVYLVEQATTDRRGLTGSFSELGCLLGTLVGGQLTLITLSWVMDQQSLESWGWRIPFLTGVLIAPYAFYVRRNIKESPEAFPKKRTDIIPIAEAFKFYWPQLLAAFFSTAFSGVSLYTILVFLPNHIFTQKEIVGADMAFVCSAITNMFMILSVAVFGHVSDKIGRKPIMISGIIGVMATCYPMIALSKSGVGFWYLMFQIMFGLSLSAFYGPRSAFMSEAFPRQIRVTAVSLVVGLCQATFGGLTPFIATYILSKTGNVSYVALLLLAVCFLAIVGTCKLSSSKMKATASKTAN